MANFITKVKNLELVKCKINNLEMVTCKVKNLELIKCKIYNLSGLCISVQEWILNNDLTPVYGTDYIWIDTSSWVDNNIWKD